ncbi:helix-turn-helix transcriptional regulator [Haloarchaeobius amylolyticus]|uniref:helix-turn-helix transcriptional regulator n=1 Tax=Haloarchaeobius amylolyticus TaxID=1198296 RepID=UPI003A8FEE97
MVSHSPIGVRAQLASIHSTISIDTGLTSTHQGVHAIPLPVRVAIGGRSGEPLQLLRTASFGDVVLVAVLFVLISVLIGIRTAAVLSERDLEISSLPLVANAAGDTAESAHARTDSPRAYETYLSPETPPRLLSDEGKVVRLLVANHGRIRQHRIADETGWSKSKVSRICSQMHADGTIEKRSVGRENVIVFADRPNDDETQSDDVENPLP